jgi:hypothetical protein
MHWIPKEDEMGAAKQWDGQPVRVPTLAEVVKQLTEAAELLGSNPAKAEVAREWVVDAIDALKTIDGALADVAHEANKIRGQR